MEFRILGPFEVADEGRPVALPGSRERAVLVLLLLSANRVVPAERLVEDLWGGKAQKGAAGALRVFVSRLRKSLRETGGDAIVLTKPPGYVVQIQRDALDAACFEDLLADGREHIARGDHEGAAARLRQALSLWRGPALADVADIPAARAESARLEEARLAALEERVEADLACGRHIEVVPELDHLTKAHPLRERLWGQRMVALYRSGRQADALRVYQELRRLLAEELGLEPSTEVARLENAILRHAPELETPARCAPKPSQMPVGPTTFLFSDIVASTQRWEGDPEAMTVDLARHDELLRFSIEAAGGEVFSHTGDGVAVAFTAAPDAVAAAVAAQRALTAAAWAAPKPLRVRMAIHAGVAQRREENYFGPPLNRVARLLCIASGGQMLCSQPAAELIGADLPADAALLDLGEHRLADLSRPERVFQVAHPDLPSQFPPLRSLGGHRHNLPVALTPFVGRTRELDEMSTLLAGSRLLTLTGVGGAGKTRLALHGAAAALSAYPDGVWMAELAPLRDGTQVPSAVAAALTFETSAVDTPEAVGDRLIRHLATRQTLLLLDNCEHLLEAVARLVHALLKQCPGVTVLITSRERLGVPGEVTWKVPPLSLPPPGAAVDELAESDAVAFFCERARAAQPAFELDDTNADSVIRICRRLDGIPLALGLAAARVQVLSPAQVADRLDDRFRLLTGRERIVVPHQQALRATIDWSYELLSPVEQRALTRLTVFPDNFDLEAAEAVISGVSGGDGGVVPEDALDVLCGLVDKSLVVVHSEGAAFRYRLLETIQQYGAEKLAEAGQEAATRRRHRDAFMARVEAWRGMPLGADFLRGAFADAENFRAALEWSWAERDAEAMLRLIGALWVPWVWFGNPDGQIWMERVFSEPEFSAPELVNHPGHVEVLVSRALLLFGDDCQRRDELFGEAAALAQRIGDDRRLACINWGRGGHRLLPGRSAEARPFLEAALAGFDRLGLPDGVGWCHDHLGWAAVVDGQYDLARDHFERAVEVARSDPLGEWLEPHALAALAPLVALSGDEQRALRLAEEAVGAARRLEARPVLAMALARAAEAAVLAGEPRRAAGMLVELLGVLADLGTQWWVADALETAALVLEVGEDAERASAILGASDKLRETAGEARGGVRVIADEVLHARERLAGALSIECFARHEARGRMLSREAAMTLTIDGLAARGHDAGHP